MDKKIYMLINTFVNQHMQIQKPILFISQKSPWVLMIIFYGLMPILILKKDLRVIPYAFFPMLTLYSVRLFRNRINRPRPFDELNVKTLEHHSSGHSFPSLHCASGFSIASSVFYISMPLGVICFVIALAIAVTRLLTGVHYPSDVVVGTIIGLIMGLPCLLLSMVVHL